MKSRGSSSSKGVNGMDNAALQLERVIGLSTLNNASFCSSPQGDLFYIAGCFVVRYNPEENKQKGFYASSKSISCISITDDGKYLAVGERGQVPATSIWHIERYEKVATLVGHKGGVGCQAFSPNGRYLVTIGFKNDRQLILWDWKANNKLTVQKLGNKVNAVCFHESGDYFVTAGDRHLKWWTIMEVLEGEAVTLEGKAASILEDQRHSVFMDVKCGAESCDGAVFCTTSTGVLCLFNESKMVEKWVQLESASSFCMELFCAEGAPGLLVVGCANGIVRCFSPMTLQYIATLPLPAPLVGAMPRANNDVTGLDAASGAVAGAAAGVGGAPAPALYAACYAMSRVAPGTRGGGGTPKLATVYADRSLFLWDISDIYAIAKYRSFLFHRACVWDIQFIEDPLEQDLDDLQSENKPQKAALPKGSFVTCSADNSIRFWNVDPLAQRLSKFRSVFSREMLHSIDLLADLHLEAGSPPGDAFGAAGVSAGAAAAVAVDASMMNTSSLSATHYLAQQSGTVADLDVCAGVPDTELPDRPQSKYAPRAMAIHPNSRELACGDKMGMLKVFDLRTMRTQHATQAHAAEILTLSYSPPLVTADGGSTWTRKGSSPIPPPAAAGEPATTSTTTTAAGAAGEDGEGKGEVVLLASAGRDRLIHVFNSCEDYTPIQTLDQHTSSVTIAKFTSDGRRFLSCGGDKSMVFCGVNGPSITRLKSVQTPHGTINGLAIEASNKFAVTSGQDKRMNIWNLQSGKHMRAYKSEHIHSELYKSDIDPSGTNSSYFILKFSAF
jgi:WD40 repeat protein